MTKIPPVRRVEALHHFDEGFIFSFCVFVDVKIVGRFFPSFRGLCVCVLSNAASDENKQMIYRPSIFQRALLITIYPRQCRKTHLTQTDKYQT